MVYYTSFWFFFFNDTAPTEIYPYGHIFPYTTRFRSAQVDSPTRSWEHGPRTRTGGYGPIGGEMATGVLADEILKPGPGRIRAMINHGGNPAVTVPDQRKIVEAQIGRAHV